MFSVKGIEISEDVPEDITLSELDFENDKSANITTYLRDVHNISVSEEHVPYLTVQKYVFYSLPT